MRFGIELCQFLGVFLPTLVCNVSVLSPYVFRQSGGVFLNILFQNHHLCCHDNQSNSVIWTKFI